VQLLCLPLIFSLGMCPSDPTDTAPNGAVEACLTREARNVVPMPVDLEGAAQIAIGQCAYEIRLARNSVKSRSPFPPGFGSDVEAQFREIDENRLNHVRQLIALYRRRN
jgi:hypothetical protein